MEPPVIPGRLSRVWVGLPRAVRLIIVNYGIGALGGLTLGIALIATDAQGLGVLLAESADPWLPTLLFLVQMALTFAALSAGVAVMRLQRDS